MNFEMPYGFAQRVNDLDLYLREEAAATNQKEKDRLLRLALVTACELLCSVDDAELEKALKEMLGPKDASARVHAREIIEDKRAFDFFLFRIEDGLFEIAGLSSGTRTRMLELLKPLRPDTLTLIESESYKDLANDYRSLRSEVCSLKEKAMEDAIEIEQIQHRNLSHTRIVNTLGAATIIINAATGLAAAASLLFLPAVSLAACAASAAVGGVAQSWQPR